jgi:hypothetical protein
LVRDTRHDPHLEESLSELLAEQDAAKVRLSALGYGVTGTSWPKIVDAIAQEREGEGV